MGTYVFKYIQMNVFAICLMPHKIADNLDKLQDKRDCIIVLSPDTMTNNINEGDEYGFQMCQIPNPRNGLPRRIRRPAPNGRKSAE
jgi:hypothetical protein